MSAELATVADTALSPVRRPALPATPLDMLNTAVATGASIEVLEKLMVLHERWEAGQARKAFDAAVSAAKGEIPPIVKNREVDFTSQKGRTNYRHEDFAGIARVVDPILNRHGLSYRHRAAQEGTRLRVTCVLSHRDGYSEETSLEAAEDHSGNKNPIQAIGSAATYLQRYTLKLALGLASSADDDGHAAGGGFGECGDAITAEQAAELRALADEVGADIRRFCGYLKVDSLAAIPASRFGQAAAALESKRARR